MFAQKRKELEQHGCRLVVRQQRYFAEGVQLAQPDADMQCEPPISYRQALNLYKNPVPTTRGGATCVTLILPNSEEYTETVMCSPKDNYNKRIGRDVALGRLIKNLDNAGLLPR
jgi:hypothetical protein